MKRSSSIVLPLMFVAMMVVKYRPEWVGLDVKPRTPTVKPFRVVTTTEQCRMYRDATDSARRTIDESSRAATSAAHAGDGDAQLAALRELDRFLAGELPMLEAMMPPPAMAEHHAAWVAALSRFELALDAALAAIAAQDPARFETARLDVLRQEDATNAHILDLIARCG
jgi:hypothetical protein